MNSTLVKLMGWKANVIDGEPNVYDQWKWVRKHLQPGPVRTLEVDCGTGCFSLFAASLGNEVLGVDADPEKIRSAESQARLLGTRTTQFHRFDAMAIAELARRKGFALFDQILCLDATPRLERESAWVSRLVELLSPGGRILLTANYKYTKANDREAQANHDGLPEEESRHGFTHEELSRRFKEAGLHITEQEYLSGLVTQTLANATRAMGNKANSTVAWGLVLPLRLLQVMDSPVTRFTRYPHQQLAVVGVKPRLNFTNASH